MKLYQLLVLVLSVLFVLSCNTDEEKNEDATKSVNKKDPNAYASGQTEKKGSSSFVVSGDHEGKYSGIAYFRSFEMKDVHSWGITLVDQKPMTYTISFTQTSDEPIEAPEVGTYKLGINPGNRQDDIYLASFEYFENDPFKSIGYSVGIAKTSGVLEVTKSTDELIEGNFSFSAVRMEGGLVEDTIEVTGGEFSAILTK